MYCFMCDFSMLEHIAHSRGKNETKSKHFCERSLSLSLSHTHTHARTHARTFRVSRIVKNGAGVFTCRV